MRCPLAPAIRLPPRYLLFPEPSHQRHHPVAVGELRQNTVTTSWGVLVRIRMISHTTVVGPVGRVIKPPAFCPRLRSQPSFSITFCVNPFSFAAIPQTRSRKVATTKLPSHPRATRGHSLYARQLCSGWVISNIQQMSPRKAIGVHPKSAGVAENAEDTTAGSKRLLSTPSRTNQMTETPGLDVTNSGKALEPHDQTHDMASEEPERYGRGREGSSDPRDTEIDTFMEDARNDSARDSSTLLREESNTTSAHNPDSEDNWGNS